MNSIIVSIVIPVYNAESYIGRCIDSIVSQLDNKFEVLLIDDGSVDSSGSICDDYAKQYSFVHVIHKVNGGVSSARNAGIEKAQGKWITFIDSDDYIDSGYFQGIEDTNNVDLIVRKKKTFGDCNDIEEYPDGEYKGNQMIQFLNENMQNELFRAPWGKFFSLRIINQYNLRFNPQYHLGEDALFVLDYLSRIECIKVSGSSFYNYFLSGDFISGRYKLSTSECVRYVKDIMGIYENTSFSCGAYLALLFGFHTGMIIHHNPKEIRNWLNEPCIRNLWKKTFKNISFRKNLKYILLYIRVYF